MKPFTVRVGEPYEVVTGAYSSLSWSNTAVQAALVDLFNCHGNNDKIVEIIVTDKYIRARFETKD